jgi:hypothetical protein
LEEARNPEAEILFKGEGPYYFITEGLKELEKAGTSWESKISLQLLLNSVRTEAKDFLYKITKPTLYVVFPNDPFTGTAEFRQEVADTMGDNVQFVVVVPSQGDYFGSESLRFNSFNGAERASSCVRAHVPTKSLLSKPRPTISRWSRYAGSAVTASRAMSSM